MAEIVEKHSTKSDGKAPSTREALLKAAIDELSSRPEGDFRIETILASTGASFSSLYHHFGNREGLVIEAQISIFKSPIAKDVGPFVAGAALVSNSEDLTKLLTAAIDSATSAVNARDRSAQLAILSAANSRPVLAEAIAKEQAGVTRQIEAAFDDLQARGLIDPAVTTALIAQFIQVSILGQSVLDLGAGPLDLKAYQDLLLKALLALTRPVQDN